MEETELMWLAGWLEGEGSFVATSGIGANGRRYPRFRVNGASTDLDTLMHVRSLAGGVVNGPYARDGRQDHWIWTLSTHEKCLWLLRELEPRMVSARRRERIRSVIQKAEEYAAVPHGRKGQD